MDPDIVAGRRRAMSLCDQMQVLNLSVDIINNGVKEICISKINSNGDAMNKSTIVRDNGTSEDFEMLTDTNNKEARQRLITEVLKSTVKKCCSQEVFGVEGDVKGPSNGKEEN